MKEFFEGFKEIYCNLFSLIYNNRRNLGKLFAMLTIFIMLIVLFASFCQFCKYLGKMQVRKAYTVEISYSGEKL